MRIPMAGCNRANNSRNPRRRGDDQRLRDELRVERAVQSPLNPGEKLFREDASEGAVEVEENSVLENIGGWCLLVALLFQC